jgi:tripartite-type tricarboxylate transporter receptor subunit TctC
MAKLTRRAFAAASAAAAAAAGLRLKPAFAQNYPARPVTVVVPWGAGGGTDATARIVAALLEKDLGQPFNVVNRTGGSGVVGHSAIATAAPDGYTIGMLTVEISMMHWQGLTELGPRSYTPLALMNEDPPGISVNGSSHYKTVRSSRTSWRTAVSARYGATPPSSPSSWIMATNRWAMR